MRKSERLRILEMQVVRLEFQIDLLTSYLNSIIETLNVEKPQLDAGKWYQRKLDGTP